MHQNIRKAADDTGYTIEREFLGDITTAELIEQIIRLHLFPLSDRESMQSQAERRAQVQTIGSENFL